MTFREIAYHARTYRTEFRLAELAAESGDHAAARHHGFHAALAVKVLHREANRIIARKSRTIGE